MSTYVMLPTYNEAENIGPLIAALLALDLPELNVLVVDDDSPDGTGVLAQEMSQRDPRVHALLRRKRRGRGFAGADGFKWCLEAGAERILEMDADFSHHPRHIPEMIRALDNADVVLGSRFAPGGADVDRSPVRKVITKLAGLYVRRLLDLNHIRDVSSGFRLFRRQVIADMDPENLFSAGPPIVTEVLYKAACLGYRIVESPIQFEDRRKGQTKLDYVTLLESLVMVLRLRQMRRSGRLPARPAR